ncbi:MAG: Dabb family protein [Verrucomicrobia bacterium]|nr:Dabb family protein [Verrucomicrobiota bacterium]MDA1005303.1 Dabb family protein [Verrucomicrobiota bacterium]
MIVKHFGMFQFKEGVTEAQIETCWDSMRGMVGKIPGLLEVHCGPYDENEEQLQDGFTHGFVMSFDRRQSRDAYLPHPEHERVKEIVIPCLERVTVFDIAV